MEKVKPPKKNVGGRPRFDFVLDEDEFGEFCVVPLAGGKYFAKIDPEDYPEIAKFKWCIAKANGKDDTIYARRAERVNKKTKCVLMHRQIMKVADGVALDHINGNGHDNRKANLRVADKAQNGWNQKIRTGNLSSKYKGVAWHKEQKKWIARLGYKRKRIWLGTYDNEVEAARAYDRAAVKYFGAFARLNFPVDSTSSLFAEAKMSYAMDEKVKTKTTKRILELKGYSAGELWEILASRPLGELENMCRVLQCNISELSKKIRKAIFP